MRSQIVWGKTHDRRQLPGLDAEKGALTDALLGLSEVYLTAAAW
jgi:hypothetical protein